MFHMNKNRDDKKKVITMNIYLNAPSVLNNIMTNLT